MRTPFEGYRRLAAAFVRGRAIGGWPATLDESACRRPLDELTDAELDAMIRAGSEAGLRFHGFKRTAGLPRVSRVIGMLRGLRPASLLDIGSGRGVALWPILDAFDDLDVTAIDRLEHRVEAIQAVRHGGVNRLRAALMDATRIEFADGSFDGVLALEVLEHVPEVGRAIREAVRVARRFVIASVPSKEDSNPEHIHLLDRATLERLFREAGAVTSPVRWRLRPPDRAGHGRRSSAGERLMNPPLIKYPRTPHIEGSRLQPGDADLDAEPFSAIAGRHLVVEEKMDGANCAFRFNEAGELLLQSRGHYLTGGPREKHFTLLKQWAGTHAGRFFERLGSRYVVFGEWLFAKHTIYYDALPHYFLEFDIWDIVEGRFLATPTRRELLAGLPIVPVRVLAVGAFQRVEDLTALVGTSGFITPESRTRLADDASRQDLDPGRVLRETDPSPIMEGLYIKAEGDAVVGRYKYIRADFLTAVTQAEGHWLNRPIVPNRLRDGVNLFAGEARTT